MVKAIGDHTQGKGLNSRDGLFASLPVYHDPGKIGYLGDPAPVVFTLDFDLHSFALLMLKSASGFFYSGGGGKSMGFRPDAPPRIAPTDAARRLASGPF
jgi:hypothetical protein